jgi:hypothetical protein
MRAVKHIVALPLRSIREGRRPMPVPDTRRAKYSAHSDLTHCRKAEPVTFPGWTSHVANRGLDLAVRCESDPRMHCTTAEIRTSVNRPDVSGTCMPPPKDEM